MRAKFAGEKHCSLASAFVAGTAAVLSLFAACDESIYTGAFKPNTAPTIKLTSGPPEGDTASYAIRFSWIGNDADGTIDHYEFAMCEGDPIGFDPQDTTGADKWARTCRTDSVFKFSADAEGDDFVWSYKHYTRFQKTHTFFIRAVDDRGGCSAPAYRSFTASTLAPYAIIDMPRNPFPGQSQSVPPVVRFGWHGEDPIDSPWNTQEADSIRYMLVPYYRGLMNELNSSPEEFEEYWTPWISYHAEGDSGVSTVIGDDEILNKVTAYIFAVQAMDEAGAVTAVFDAASNVRLFAVMENPGPVLRVSEQFLGTWHYVGINNRAAVLRLPAGFVFNFTWEADASSYGGDITSYRYGWDVIDLNDPDQWAVDPNPYIRSAPPVPWNSGVHTLFVEAVDNNGVATIAQIEINTFVLDMSRNLLWIDDFYSTDDFQNYDMSFPTEKEHDSFWLARCSRARDFNPAIDQYDAAVHNFQPPDIELLWRYKNVIWSYSSHDDINAWDNMVRFMPESYITATTPNRFNFLAYYLASGGHIWTEGKSDKAGGLIAVMFPQRQFVPINLRCEITGPRTGCDGDTSGVKSIAYKDYCVSVIDKIVATVRIDPRIPSRDPNLDAMTYAYRDPSDSYTLGHSGLPTTLRLWYKVIAPNMFFDPQIRGFLWGEVYNPGYWMSAASVRQQGCFHPMFRMYSRHQLSPINKATIAFWTTKHAGVTAPVPGCVAAASVHFGLPLWYFDRAQVDSIADVVFREWGINAY